MSRVSIPFHAEDISALSRSLSRQLTDLGHVPGHLEMLNLLARAAGFRNFQGLRASHSAQARMAAEPRQRPVDFTVVARLARYFDAEGRLARWPGKASHRLPCLWVVWSRLPPRRAFTEKEVNEFIRAAERIGDHLLLRRAMVDAGLLTRRIDGGEYRRVEGEPPAEVVAVMRHLSKADHDHS